MSIYIGNNLEDRLEAFETEDTLLKKYNEYREIVDEIDHMSDYVRFFDRSIISYSMIKCKKTSIIQPRPNAK